MDLLRRSAATYPQRPAVALPGGPVLTYAELERETARIAAAGVLESEKITTWYSVPGALRGMLRRGRLAQRDLRHLRTVLFAVESYPAEELYALQAVMPDVALLQPLRSHGDQRLHLLAGIARRIVDLPVDPRRLGLRELRKRRGRCRSQADRRRHPRGAPGPGRHPDGGPLGRRRAHRRVVRAGFSPSPPRRPSLPHRRHRQPAAGWELRASRARRSWSRSAVIGWS